MLPKGAISAQRVWKRFHADKRPRRVRDALQRVGRRPARATRWRWALRDVSLDVKPGESVGLVGTNGSGKSTLLKILTRVMYPYAGSVAISGRVGALIEVRAGLHPELTGRENIFLYGSLLGCPRKQVAARFDEILEFAELTAAVDRQVKFYSSGMQMRLGFGVAAFLQPDILLVDEVLAVGDATFQQRCLDRIRSVLMQGTSLVFVSHDLAAVEATCQRGVWLRDGVTVVDGPVREVLASYRRSIEEVAEHSSPSDAVVALRKAAVTGPNATGIRTHEALTVRLTVQSPETRAASLVIGVSDGPATPVFLVRREMFLDEGDTEVKCTVPDVPLPCGRFYLWSAVFSRKGRELLPWHPVLHFDVSGPDLDPPPPAVVRVAPIHVKAEWESNARHA